MATETFLKTGKFAELCHTTKETLFHYDREGILKPKYVSDNGYRRYGMNQYFDFELISLLKDTGSTLGEIRNYREAGDPRAYLRLLRERVEVSERERARLARREAMLKDLIRLTEEALDAEYDTLLFEERGAEWVTVIPTVPEKMVSGAGSAECYAACLARELERGKAPGSPLGMVVPEESAKKGEFRLCHLFTRAEADDRGDLRELPGGRYAVFFHKGEVAGQAAAFRRMVEAIEREGLRMVGDAYIYDQMSYFLTGASAEYAAKHIMRVERG